MSMAAIRALLSNSLAALLLELNALPLQSQEPLRLLKNSPSNSRGEERSAEVSEQTPAPNSVNPSSSAVVRRTRPSPQQPHEVAEANAVADDESERCDRSPQPSRPKLASG